MAMWFVEMLIENGRFITDKYPISRFEHDTYIEPDPVLVGKVITYCETYHLITRIEDGFILLNQCFYNDFINTELEDDRFNWYVRSHFLGWM